MYKISLKQDNQSSQKSQDFQILKEEFSKKAELFWRTYVPKFRKAGTWYTGICPLHDDTNPSFRVKVTNPFYFKCYGCEKKGDAIYFLQKLEGIDRKEATRKLIEFLELKNLIDVTETTQKRDVISEIAEESEKELKKINFSEYDNVSFYTYCDFEGNFLYTKLKFYDEQGNKDFRIYDKDGNPGKKDQGQVLFGLQFFDKTKKGLALCEGEKDVETLRKIEPFFKECNVFGYNSFATEIRNTFGLKGSRDFKVWLKNDCESIFIFEDNDERGYKNTTEILHELKRRCIYQVLCVHFHQYDRGFDITDYLESKEIDIKRLSEIKDHKEIKDLIDELVSASSFVTVLTPRLFRERQEEICKYQRNVFIVKDKSIFSNLFESDVRNLVIFNDDVVYFEVNELESLFKDAIVYIDKEVYHECKKFPFLEFSFLSRKTFLIDEIGVEELFDKEKKVTEVDFHERKLMLEDLIKQIRETRDEEKRKKLLEELKERKKVRLFDELMQIPEGSVSVITGLGASGKTTFVCLYSIYLAFKKSCNVAIITLEESREYIENRIDNALMPVFLSDLSKEVRKKISIFSAAPYEVRFLIDFCLREHDVVFVDSLSYILTDENKNEQASQFFTHFVQLAYNTKKNIVFLHHANKKFVTDYVYTAKSFEELKILSQQNAVRGASAIINDARTVFLMIKDANGDPFIFTIKKNLTEDVCYKIAKFHLCYENYIEKVEKHVDGYYERCDVDDFFVEAEPVLHSEVRNGKKREEEKKKKIVGM